MSARRPWGVHDWSMDCLAHRMSLGCRSAVFVSVGCPCGFCGLPEACLSAVRGGVHGMPMGVSMACSWGVRGVLKLKVMLVKRTGPRPLIVGGYETSTPARQQAFHGFQWRFGSGESSRALEQTRGRPAGIGQTEDVNCRQKRSFRPHSAMDKIWKTFREEGGEGLGCR